MGRVHPSWWVALVVLAVGLILVGASLAAPRPGAVFLGVGWGLLLVDGVLILFAPFRFPAMIRRARLRTAWPGATVEMITRTGPLSIEIAQLNRIDGGHRDSTWGMLCLACDEIGMSAWRWNDSEEPDWTLPWSALSEPTVGKVAFAGSVYRGLVMRATLGDQSLDLHFILVGAGFLGLFTPLGPKLSKIAAQFAEWREIARRRPATP
jgi:hypothetical protein